MIVGSGGQVSVRHNHSEKYTFRNPFWEEEFSRINARKQAGQSVAALHVEAESIKTRVNVVFRELEGYGAHSWADCREGAPPPSPQKPVTVVPSEDRPATASQVCAVAWEDTLQEMAGKLYVMAKRQAIWDRRAQGVEIQRKLKVFMTTPDEDKIQGLELAAAQGERFTQYQEALAFFKSLTSECEQKAVELLHEGARQWEDRVAYVAATPQRLLQQCQQTAQTHQQLSLDLSNVESKLTQAEQELARLREPPLSSGTARSLLSFTCTDR
ncbi:MAG: hypothetical protein E8D42_06765 [Nitrospira sp.]|nr:MAG: hypothetical protein E8D42_06765 [Nitrospira sp.]